MESKAKKKRIEVNPSAIKRNRSNKGGSSLAPAVKIFPDGDRSGKVILCAEVSIDGPSKIVYERSVGVWVETEAKVICHCEDGDKVFE